MEKIPWGDEEGVSYVGVEAEIGKKEWAYFRYHDNQEETAAVAGFTIRASSKGDNAVVLSEG